MKGLGKNVVLSALLLLALLWTVVPLGWMVLSSFKKPDDLVSQTPQLFFAPTFQNYIGLFTGGNALGDYITNSILAAGISTVIAVTLGCLAG